VAKSSPKGKRTEGTGGPGQETAQKNVYVNRKAKHDYFIMSTIEAGVALVGSEVKSIRQGKISLQDSYAVIEHEEAYILNMHVSPYEKSTYFTPEPKRKRKLLLNKSEIKRLMGKITEKGLTLIPLRVYLLRGKVKIELALARGRPKRDKRQQIAKRDAEREMRKEAARRR
jgi:SsrA-binding protein